ncbi:MAG: hypothetical protein IPJ20_21220 [Flammeovirgaceae bacterium]|nr:hypothetical protein [Flammeovirgaceae bacterium]
MDADKTYYVGALNANGCEGTERKSVDVKVKKLVDAVIEDSSLDILSSNYETGNQWYLDNEMIMGETNRTLIVREVGIYDLKVSMQGCEVSTTNTVLRTEVVTGLEETLQSVDIYPNPATEIIVIHASGQDAIS